MKILHIDKNHATLKNDLALLACENHEDYTSSKSEIEAKIHLYDGIVIRSRFNIDQTFINAATNLKFIARVGAGLESIDCDYAQSKNIKLIAAPEGNMNAVAEHALGMILSLFNHLKKADIEIRQGQWLREANRGLELDGKTIGLIGYGNMGKAFAKKLKGFDCNVICYDLKKNIGDENCQQVTLEELQKRTEILSIHTPHNTASFKMIDAEFIHKFQHPFYIINTARGTAIVTDAMVEALQSKKILGACLDVLEYEKSSFENLFENKQLPAAFKYLINAQNVLLSPHIAGWTVESKYKLAKTITQKIHQHFFN